MLKNFVVDADLKVLHPNVVSDLWSGQTSYSLQIEEAFSSFSNDLINNNVDIRSLSVPFDLKRLSAAPTFLPAFRSSETATTTGSTRISTEELHRFVVEIDGITGGWTLKLQGSNDSSNWTNVSNASLTLTAVGTSSSAFVEQYRAYRYISEPSTTGSAILDYACYLVDSKYDKSIIHKAFVIIFTDFRQVLHDRWDELRAYHEEEYTRALNAIKLQYQPVENITEEDIDDSYVPTYMIR